MLPEPSLFNCKEHTCGLIHPLDQVVVGSGERWDGKAVKEIQEETVNRRWYLLVIGLLYVGLIISFCLNVTLLLRRGGNNVNQKPAKSDERGLLDPVTGLKCSFFQ